jgi:hypothetical protein
MTPITRLHWTRSAVENLGGVTVGRASDAL